MQMEQRSALHEETFCSLHDIKVTGDAGYIQEDCSALESFQRAHGRKAQP